MCSLKEEIIKAGPTDEWAMKLKRIVFVPHSERLRKCRALGFIYLLETDRDVFEALGHQRRMKALELLIGLFPEPKRTRRTKRTDLHFKKAKTRRCARV